MSGYRFLAACGEGRKAAEHLIYDQAVAHNLKMWSGLWNSCRALSHNSQHNIKGTKQPLKKPTTPQGKFDDSEQTTLEKNPLEKFPDDINPVTKEKGGPRGPEPTRYGDWERKGRCIDF
ncbi:succinate dehydrogenase assembly factor 4, mitochondrial [Xenopus tropicalis]|uniref:Succinate dehydrogenase assembly factor 4, mitochondrial n=1 Tax=Xenopus tropicalis TaxID=8364 RepID=Q640U1_XENTR|eukprot:NP_001008179.1 succinate dehydrogenase assembly factor 4, mitochondrial [Xenopus tropicalis]